MIKVRRRSSHKGEGTTNDTNQTNGAKAIASATCAGTADALLFNAESAKARSAENQEKK